MRERGLIVTAIVLPEGQETRSWMEEDETSSWQGIEDDSSLHGVGELTVVTWFWRRAVDGLVEEVECEEVVAW